MLPSRLGESSKSGMIVGAHRFSGNFLLYREKKVWLKSILPFIHGDKNEEDSVPERVHYKISRHDFLFRYNTFDLFVRLLVIGTPVTRFIKKIIR